MILAWRSARGGRSVITYRKKTCGTVATTSTWATANNTRPRHARVSAEPRFIGAPVVTATATRAVTRSSAGNAYSSIRAAYQARFAPNDATEASESKALLFPPRSAARSHGRFTTTGAPRAAVSHGRTVRSNETTRKPSTNPATAPKKRR